MAPADPRVRRRTIKNCYRNPGNNKQPAMKGSKCSKLWLMLYSSSPKPVLCVLAEKKLHLDVYYLITAITLHSLSQTLHTHCP